MIRIQKIKITALLCALALMVSSIGFYINDVRAASLPVTSDDAPLSQETTERNPARSIGAKTGAQQLKFGKKVQGRLVSGDDGQRYQVTLKSSGQLDIHFEGAAGKLVSRLTDKNGKGWAPRRRTADGKQTYQLRKGTYYCQVQAIKGAAVPQTGLGYAVTVRFKSAKAKFENHTTRKKAAKLPFYEVFYGHLASNSPVEYYKFTLDKQSYFSFSLTTQITDYAPETFVVTLYNKYGKRMTDWENPDWVEYFKAPESYVIGKYNFTYGDWYVNDEMSYSSYDRGMCWVLPAGDYYVGVSVKRDKGGKVPAAARYGRYAAFAATWSPSVSVELSHNQAEYTGKRIKLPKVTIKGKKPYLKRNTGVPRYWEEGITEGTGYTPKKIGRYMIIQTMWWVDQEFDDNDTVAYAIFTVTPVRGKVRSASSRKPGEVQVSVKKNAQSTGCQIQIARDKKFKKSVKTIKTTNVRKTIKGLLHGKKYYVRVRNYKDVKTRYFKHWGVNDSVEETIYGKWSKVRTVVCK